jgi:hypothetical protein
MLSIKELEKLYDILNSKDLTLDKISENFSAAFN